MDSHVRKYDSCCEACHRIIPPPHTRPALNMALETPSRPCEGVIMDFITGLPESMVSRYTGILVIVDFLTKMGIYLLCPKDIDSPELPRLSLEHVTCQRGVPDNIVTDRSTQFTSRFGKRICSHLSTDHRLSTAVHPQMDGQTERHNQTTEQYLRAIRIYEQDLWVEHLPLASFVYNNSTHTSTRMTS